MHSIEHLFVLVRPRDSEDIRVVFADVIGFGAQTAGYDHFAIFHEGFTDGIKAFRLGRVEKPAGVHNYSVRARIVGADRIAFGPQACQDAFTVDQGLGATEGHHADGRLAVTFRLRKARFRGKVGAEVWRVLGHGARIAPELASGKWC